ncbi:MAG: hypothetical protein IKD46_07560 [Lentisphaeria bacterium]|nr:hypothetical protein [Lentisphaeria bacterium]
MQQNNWKWEFLRESDQTMAARDPEAMIWDHDMIKNTPFRVVCRKNGNFVKLYITPPGTDLFKRLKNRFFPKARSEFETLCELQKHCIPVVEPVGWGQNGSYGSCLITREIPNSVSANDFFHMAVGEENKECPEFFTKWSSFVRDFLRSGFDHPDFHNGNILYREENNTFALVDVYGIRQKHRPDVQKMAKIVREFAAYLPKSRLLALLEGIGIVKPEKFYREMLRYGAKQIRKEFPRRLAQFRNHYEKFVKVQGKMVRTLNGARKPIPLENTIKTEVSPQEAQKLREMDFFLNLCNIPRLRIAAFEPPGILYVEKVSDRIPAGSEEDLVERLTLCGEDPKDYFFTADRFGRAVVVPNIFKSEEF